MWKDFKQFILRGNTVDLAVGVVIGASFNAVVNSFVKDLVTPLVGIFLNSKNFSSASFTLYHNHFMYGDFIDSFVSFLIVAAVVFFFVVKPINKLTEYAQRRKGTLNAATKKCEYCLSEIPREAIKCMYCTSKLEHATT